MHSRSHKIVDSTILWLTLFRNTQYYGQRLRFFKKNEQNALFFANYDNFMEIFDEK